jgi:cell division protein FtsN
MVETRRGGVAGSGAARERGRRRQRGGTVIGFLAGLIVGLSIAVIVALFVTRAPVPFVNKGHRMGERTAEPRNGAVLPDPNAPLQAQPGAEAAPPGSPAAALPAPAATAPVAPAEERAATDSGYMLQAGAFRSSDDADGMRARLALLGFEARVVAAEVGGQPMYRVRIGPFAQQEDANRARARLIDGGIEASVVRQR